MSCCINAYLFYKTDIVVGFNAVFFLNRILYLVQLYLDTKTYKRCDKFLIGPALRCHYGRVCFVECLRNYGFVDFFKHIVTYGLLL